MAENALSSSEKVADIKGKLAKVLSSLDKYENSKPTARNSDITSKLEVLAEKSSDLFNEKLSKTREDFGHQISSIIHKFNTTIELNTEKLFDNLRTSQNPPKNNNLFIEKVHRKQSAPISKLLYNKDFQTIYNIFLAILVNIGIAELAQDILNTNNVVDPLGVKLFTGNFSKFDSVIKIWVVMFTWSYSTILLVQISNLSIYLIFLLHLLSIVLLGFATITYTLEVHLPIASSFIVLCEMIRFCMKMHSYFREKMLHGKGPNKFTPFLPKYAVGYDQGSIQIPKINILSLAEELQRYTYYQFAPTLIYRDTYPKIDRSIRWKNLGVHLFDFFGGIIYTALIFKAFCVPEFQSASKDIKNSQALIISWFRAMLPGTMVFLLLFFAVMHSWFSIWAEILNFADRKFYDD